MKKLVLILAFFSSLFAEFSLENGLWYMSWEQSDKPNDSKISSPIENKFTINDALVYEFGISGKYKNIKAYGSYLNFEDTPEHYTEKADKMTQYSGYLGLDFENIESAFKYRYSKTDGTANGIDPDTLKKARVEFNTELRIYDLIFYPKFSNLPNYIGIGYRNINYTLPQSLYVIADNKVVDKMVEPQMEWDANYITLSVDNSRKILDKYSYEKMGDGYFINLMYGYGFDVKADSSVATKTKLNSYIKNPKGDFLETEVGYLLFKRIAGGTLYLKVGYRYIEQILETSKSDVYIYAKSTSKFQGAFFSMGVSF